MFRGFDELFGEKLEKVAPFVKKDKRSSISQKFYPFCANHHVSRF